jgi:hypothetical protein
MYMIGHQTITQQRKTVKLRTLAQQLKVSDAIRIAGENHLSSIPALRNMMGDVNDHNPRQSSHTKKISEKIWSADNIWTEFAFVIPRSGGNNWGTSRLSPGSPGSQRGGVR